MSQINTNNSFVFSALMSIALFAIILFWLIASSFLLGIPLLSNFSFGTLGFIFGVLLGLFASSWAIVYILAPYATNYSSFCETLSIHLHAHPALYLLHGLVFAFILLWSFFLFKGLLARTTKPSNKKIIKLCGGIVVITVFAIVTYLLFGDFLISDCQSSSVKVGWLDWMYPKQPINLTPSETALKVAQITQLAVDEGIHICCNAATKPEEIKCWEIFNLFKQSSNEINLSMHSMKKETTTNVVTGVGSGLHYATEQIVTPLMQKYAEIGLHGAATNVAKSIFVK